jgi:hypothetical protein
LACFSWVLLFVATGIPFLSIFFWGGGRSCSSVYELQIFGQCGMDRTTLAYSYLTLYGLES